MFVMAGATGFEQLLVARMLTGACVAGISAASSLTVLDIATPLNRTRTMAPVGMAMTTGIAVGPALGGILLEGIGMRPTFVFTGYFEPVLHDAKYFTV